MSDRVHSSCFAPRTRALSAALALALAGTAASSGDAFANDATVRQAARHQQFEHAQRGFARHAQHASMLQARRRTALSNYFASIAHPPSTPRARQRHMVLSSLDSGPGSLRELLADAVDGDVIDASQLHGRIVLSAALTTDADVTIRGPGRDNLILDGGGHDRVFASAHTLTLSDVTIANGTAAAGPPIGGCLIAGIAIIQHSTITGCHVVGDSDPNGTYPSAIGGAVYALGAAAVKYSTISNSSAAAFYAYGGGFAMGNKYVSGPPGGAAALFAYSTISGNTANAVGGGAGGGIFIASNQSTDPLQTQLYFSTVSGNSATSSGYYNATSYTEYSTTAGGGIYLGRNNTALIGASTITGNSTHSQTQNHVGLRSSFGGGIFTGGMAPAGATLEVDDSTVSGNSTTSDGAAGYGGGIASSLPLTIANSMVSGNTVTATPNIAYYSLGGGVFGQHGVTLSYSTVSGNTVSTPTPYGYSVGGGVASYLYAAAPNTANITLGSSTVSGNTVTSGYYAGGGGVYVGSAGSLLTNNSTIAFNTADTSGGGVFFGSGAASGTHTMTSTIIADNRAGIAPDDAPSDLEAAADAPSVGGSNNLVVAPIGVTLPGDTLSDDPLLKPLAYNGGVTKSHALDPLSPAIDKGIADPSVTKDQRGTARTIGVAPDIGSYEYDPDYIFRDSFNVL
ncbi:MAG TPA: choice-of-anchor Q domain-containing protein [Rudaea sp.]